MCVICVWVCAHERRCSQRSEGLEFCGTEVSGSSEPLDVGAGTET